MTTEEFRLVLAGAAWDIDLDAFCEALGWRKDDYAKQKFLDFQTIGRLLSNFDPVTLDMLVQTHLAMRAGRRL